MRRPPPLSDIGRYPITGALALLSLAATLMWWAERLDVALFAMDLRAFESQPWRLITTVLFHIDALHLAFNLFWLWVLGTVLEERLGAPLVGALYVVLGVGPVVAEYAFFGSGVGLSGIGYGLFGLLWVAGRRDRRFAGVVDRRTTELFVLWFFLCVVVTAADLWSVANVAHGAGAVFGGLIGLAWTERARGRRVLLAAVTLAGFLAAAWGATAGRPLLNRSEDAGRDVAFLAQEAAEDGRAERARDLYLEALRYDDTEPGWWNNLGVAYEELGERERSLDAYRRAHALKPNKLLYRANLSRWWEREGMRRADAGDWEGAVEAWQRAVERWETAALRLRLAQGYGRLGRAEDASREAARAQELAAERAREERGDAPGPKTEAQTETQEGRDGE